MKKLTIIILTIICNLASASNVEKTTIFTFHKDVRNRSIPFHVFPSKTAMTIFRHAHWGISIESVKVDGKIIEPHRFEAFYFDDVDFSTSIIKSDVFSYLASEKFFLFCEGEVSMNYKMISFILPDKFDTIDIHYKVRYADNSLSPLYRAFGINHSSPPKGKSELGGMISRN